jgi:hypothetical protein
MRAQTGLYGWGLPAGGVEIKAAKRHIKVEQALKARLAK